MLLSQRPLTPARQDLELAVNTRVEDAKRIHRNAGRGRNTLLMGPRGSGRTSMLSLIESMFADVETMDVRRVDAEACTETDELVATILAALDRDPRVDREERRPLFNPNQFYERVVQIPRAANETDAAAIRDAANRLASTGVTVIVLIDNLAPAPAHDLFGRFRDTMWSASVVWIGCGDSDRDGYLRPPADVFWEVVEWIEPFTGDEVTELLSRRVAASLPDDPDAILVKENLAALVSRLGDDPTPRQVVRTAAELVESGSIGAAIGSQERFERAEQAGGRRAAMLLAELEGLGRPVHAGDQELMTRMGLTRARLVQLLSALETAALVKRRVEGRKVLFEVRR